MQKKLIQDKVYLVDKIKLFFNQEKAPPAAQEPLYFNYLEYLVNSLGHNKFNPLPLTSFNFEERKKIKIDYKLDCEWFTKERVEYTLNLLPEHLILDHLTLRKAREAGEGVAHVYIFMKNTIFFKKAYINDPDVILHEYVHLLDYQQLISKEVKTKIFKLLGAENNTTHKKLLRDMAQDKKTITYLNRALLVFCTYSLFAKFNLIGLLIISPGWTLEALSLGAKLLSKTNIFKAPENIPENYPSEYSLKSTKELIAELVTSCILYGDAYRLLPKDAVLFQAYQLVTEEILLGAEYTRDLINQPVRLKRQGAVR